VKCPKCGHLFTANSIPEVLPVESGRQQDIPEVMPVVTARSRGTKRRQPHAEGPIVQAVGVDGRVELWPGKVIIRPAGPWAVLSRFMEGDLEILVSSITSVQFKRCGLLPQGQIRFSFAGGSRDHTDVYFSRSQQADFERFKKALDKMMDESHRTAKGGSGAEELERYARLLEKGHITKEEFNQKKRQILEG
jgi:hypothetical protein